MNTASRSDRKVQLAFGGAILSLLVVGAVSLRATIVFSVSDRWVRHTHDVLEKLHDLSSAMGEVEASCRGFVLTGDESYLDTCRSSKVAVTRAEEMVSDLTVDNPVQQRQIPGLQKLTAEKFALAEKVVSLRRAQGLAAAAAAIQKGSGQQLMAEFQGLVHQMQEEELRLLVLRDADAKHRLAQTKTVLLFGTLLGVLIAAGAGWTVRHDSAARDLAVDALREGEERFSTLANNISQLAWMADEKGYIFWYNDRWFDYTGTTLAEVTGWDGQKMLHPDHQQRVMEKIKHCFAKGEVWEDTFPLRGRDGLYRWFLSRAVPIRDPQGKILRWFGTNTDVTEGKALEEALFVEKERAQVTLNSIGDAVICTDVLGNITFLNPVAERMTGWSHREAAGRPMPEVFRALN